MIVDVALYGTVQPVLWRTVGPEVERLAKDPGLAFVPNEEKALWVRDPGQPSAAYPTVASFMKQYGAAGGKILSSTDGNERSNIVPGLGLHVVMQGIANMGVPAMTVIQGATLWPAKRWASTRITAAWRSAKSRTSSSSRAILGPVEGGATQPAGMHRRPNATVIMKRCTKAVIVMLEASFCR